MIQPDEEGNLSQADVELLKYYFVKHANFYILALIKYLAKQINTSNPQSINGKLISDYQNSNNEKISRYYDFILETIKEQIDKKSEIDRTFVLSTYFKSRETYSELQSVLEKKIREVGDLENLKL